MANPNPSPETRFGAENGNPIAGGKSSAQRKAEYEAAEKSAQLRARMLSYIMESTEGDDAALIEYLKGDVLKLFKDSEDRAHGTPTTTIAGDPERPLVSKVVREIVRPENTNG